MDMGSLKILSLTMLLKYTPFPASIEQKNWKGIQTPDMNKKKGND